MQKNFNYHVDLNETYNEVILYVPYIPLLRIPMKSPEECFHPELTFGSGDYYIFCNRCGRKWATMGDHPEYGQDSHGQPIGADPQKANRLNDFTKFVRSRVLLEHD